MILLEKLNMEKVNKHLFFNMENEVSTPLRLRGGASRETLPMTSVMDSSSNNEVSAELRSSSNNNSDACVADTNYVDTVSGNTISSLMTPPRGPTRSSFGSGTIKCAGMVPKIKKKKYQSEVLEDIKFLFNECDPPREYDDVWRTHQSYRQQYLERTPPLFCRNQLGSQLKYDEQNMEDATSDIENWDDLDSREKREKDQSSSFEMKYLDDTNKENKPATSFQRPTRHQSQLLQTKTSKYSHPRELKATPLPPPTQIEEDAAEYTCTAMIQDPYIENLRTRTLDDANMDWKMEKNLQKQKEVELKAMEEELYKEQKALQREQFAMLVADRFETDCKSQTVAEDAVHAAQVTVTSSEIAAEAVIEEERRMQRALHFSKRSRKSQRKSRIPHTFQKNFMSAEVKPLNLINKLDNLCEESKRDDILFLPECENQNTVPQDTMEQDQCAMKQNSGFTQPVVCNSNELIGDVRAVRNNVKAIPQYPELDQFQNDAYGNLNNMMSDLDPGAGQLDYNSLADDEVPIREILSLSFPKCPDQQFVAKGPCSTCLPTSVAPAVQRPKYVYPYEERQVTLKSMRGRGVTPGQVPKPGPIPQVTLRICRLSSPRTSRLPSAHSSHLPTTDIPIVSPGPSAQMLSPETCQKVRGSGKSDYCLPVFNKIRKTPAKRHPNQINVSAQSVSSNTVEDPNVVFAVTSRTTTSPIYVTTEGASEPLMSSLERKGTPRPGHVCAPYTSVTRGKSQLTARNKIPPSGKCIVPEPDSTRVTPHQQPCIVPRLTTRGSIPTLNSRIAFPTAGRSSGISSFAREGSARRTKGLSSSRGIPGLRSNARSSSSVVGSPYASSVVRPTTSASLYSSPVAGSSWASNLGRLATSAADAEIPSRSKRIPGSKSSAQSTTSVVGSPCGPSGIRLTTLASPYAAPIACPLWALSPSCLTTLAAAPYTSPADGRNRIRSKNKGLPRSRLNARSGSSLVCPPCTSSDVRPATLPGLYTSPVVRSSWALGSDGLPTSPAASYISPVTGSPWASSPDQPITSEDIIYTSPVAGQLQFPTLDLSAVSEETNMYQAPRVNSGKGKQIQVPQVSHRRQIMTEEEMEKNFQTPRTYSVEFIGDENDSKKFGAKRDLMKEKPSNDIVAERPDFKEQHGTPEISMQTPLYCPTCAHMQFFDGKKMDSLRDFYMPRGRLIKESPVRRLPSHVEEDLDGLPPSSQAQVCPPRASTPQAASPSDYMLFLDDAEEVSTDDIIPLPVEQVPHCLLLNSSSWTKSETSQTKRSLLGDNTVELDDQLKLNRVYLKPRHLRQPQDTGLRLQQASCLRPSHARQMSGVRLPQASDLRQSQASGLRPSQASGLRPSQASGLRPSQASSLRPPQASGLRPPQASGLRPPQASGLRPPQALGLRPPQASGLKSQKASGLKPSKASGLRTPGTSD